MADLKPVYKKINGDWVKQTAYERQNGAWVLISTAEQAAYYLYGTPSESGNVAIAEGDGYVVYKGDVLPNIYTVYTDELKATYPYLTMYINSINGKLYALLTNVPLVTNETGTALSVGAYKGMGCGLNDDASGWTVTFEPHEYPFNAWNCASIVWVNYDICLKNDSSVVFMSETYPIPLASSEPVAAVYGGVKLSVLPEYDESVYHTATIWRHPLTNDYYFTAGDDFVYLTNISDHTFGCNEAQHWRYSNNVWYQYSGFATTDFQFMVAIGSNGVVWTNTDILYADQSVAHAKTDPIPIYEQKE